MPVGARRRRLADLVGEVLDREFAERVLPFDVRCAPRFASFLAARRASGRPVSNPDAQIVAIALAHGADGLATRNTKDFEGSGLRLIDPWRD